MHQVQNATTCPTKVEDILAHNEKCNLSSLLGINRFMLFCNAFENEVYTKMDFDMKDMTLDIVVKDIKNDKYAKYCRINQIEFIAFYKQGTNNNELKCQFETYLVEPEKETPFEECSLMSKYKKTAKPAKVDNHGQPIQG